MKYSLPIVLAAALVSGAAVAADNSGSAADLLLKSVAPVAPANPTPGAAPTAGGAKDALDTFDLRSFQLNDPLSVALFSELRSQRNLPYEVMTWTGKILKGDYVGAAHLWSAIQPQIPASFEQSANAAQLYNLWKLGLAQTFFNEWTSKLSSKSFRESKLATELERTIAPGFDQWILDNAIVATNENSSPLVAIFKANTKASEPYYTLKAWLALRKGIDAGPALETLPPSNKLAIPLARTIALGFAKKGDVSSAAKILKRYVEPAIEASKDPMQLAAHYLQVARLLYQSGLMDAAEQYYEKIPNKVPHYLNAREELAWVLLRKNDSQKLRGEVKTLASSLFEDHFQPEVPVVRAISNLKLCFYDATERDLNGFQATYTPAIKLIETNLKAESPQKPAQTTDYFSQLAEKTVEKRTQELARLQALGQESITAVVPAVGEQAHWKSAAVRMAAIVQSSNQALVNEYRRQWKNQYAMVGEAIKKMNFVKVEYLSQLHELANSQGINSDQLSLSQASPKKESLNKEEKIDLVFPFDGVMWPDELFRLRGLAQNRCLERAGK
ncbi:hypothetical protein K2X30_04995 [bacterium]|jgi:tetratricopeptide (TPR) repeat protein|nr:hypothetical protein [bacterium]